MRLSGGLPPAATDLIVTCRFFQLIGVCTLLCVCVCTDMHAYMFGCIFVCLYASQSMHAA